MITMDFLENITKKMTGWEKNISVEDCQKIIDHWRLNGDEVPGSFTAGMLHKLYSGCSARDILDQMGRAAGYQDVLGRLQWVEADYNRDVKIVEDHNNGTNVLDSDALQETKERIRKEIAVKDTIWWIISRIGVPLQQLQIGENEFMWTIDADRC